MQLSEAATELEALSLASPRVETGLGLQEAELPAGEGLKPAPVEYCEVDELTCAICLAQIELANLAQLKGCSHSYCTTCILQWAVQKEEARCPQCKAPFSTLITYRSLDGQLHDAPGEESVCLLKRAPWFLAHCQALEKDRPPPRCYADTGGAQGSVVEEADWQDYGRYYDEFDADDETEAFYFSAAAGRARIVIGNRRWGEHGYVSSGRMQARPAPRPRLHAKGGAKKVGPGTSASAGSQQASGSAASAGTPCAKAGPAAKLRTPQSSGSSSSSGGRRSVRKSSEDEDAHGASGNTGRRARRNLRRAAADARGGLEL